jgi:hypothetical protein
VDEPIIAASARRHGVSDDAILHAFDNPIRSEELDEVATSDAGPVIVHAMPARPKYLR